MTINHNIIRGILKWGMFALFTISIGNKLKAILKYGGTTPNKDPNEDIQTVEDGPVHQDYDIDIAEESDNLFNDYTEAASNYGNIHPGSDNN
jgi:hypothetical protein